MIIIFHPDCQVHMHLRQYHSDNIISELSDICEVGFELNYFSYLYQKNKNYKKSQNNIFFSVLPAMVGLLHPLQHENLSRICKHFICKFFSTDIKINDKYDTEKRG